jgi:hypothetical protein
MPTTSARLVLLCAIASGAAVAACRGQGPREAPAAAPTPAAFVADANESVLRLGNAAQQASYVQSTYITPDTEAISARAYEAYVTAITGFAKRAATLDDDDLRPSVGHREADVDRGDHGESEGIDGRRIQPPERKRRRCLDHAHDDSPGDRRAHRRPAPPGSR